MRVAKILIAFAVFAGVASCDVSTTGLIGTTGGGPGLRIVNAFTGPVDVLIDGNVILSALGAGQINTAAMAAGNHTLELRPTAGGTSISQSVTAASGALSTIAATLDAGGALSAAVLDDTNSVVPDGATKLRVLHLAPNAGTLQVYRTQPDYQTPVSWQFPFDYEADPTDLSAPFYQSTVGNWEVRVWQSPADASGWDTATTRVVVPLVSGAKATIVILDKAGGGVTVKVI
jgi:hypothetical protein